jgi:hypothetical protein
MSSSSSSDPMGPAKCCNEEWTYTSWLERLRTSRAVSLRCPTSPVQPTLISTVSDSGQGPDATGFRLIGTVTDENGQRYHLVAVLLGTVASGSTLKDFIVENRAAKIQLTPIGH